MAYKLNIQNLTEELMEFQSSYAEEADVDGDVFFCEEDYNNFVAEQISLFTATLLRSIEKVEKYDFEYMVQVFGGFLSDDEFEAYFTCPYCGTNILRCEFEASIEPFCPECGGKLI